jgi:hypothetical protein
MIVTPGWYLVDVKKVETAPAKTDQSTNFIFILEIVSDLKGDTQFAEVQLKKFYINEKAIYSTGLAFLEACGLDKDSVTKLRKKEVQSIPIDENACVDKRIKCSVINTTWEGRVGNEAKDFLPL